MTSARSPVALRALCVSLLPLVAGLAACTGTVGPAVTPGGSGGSSGGLGGSSGGLGGSSGGLGGSSGGLGGMMVTTCVPGVPATTQIPRMTTVQYDAVMKDLLGVTTLATAGNAPPSSLIVADSAGALTDIAWNGYLNAAEKIAAEVMAGANKSRFITCDPAVGTCLTDTIRTFGRKAFRRPLTAAEITSFQRFNNLTPKGTPTEVAEAILYAFLASPSFIMLPELAQDPEGAAVKLNSHEVAARLSFLFWNSFPDDVLNTAADAGQLTNKAQILGQAQRLLQSDRAAAVVRSFHQYYVALQPGSHWVNNTEHDMTLYPNFVAAAYAPMMTEIDSFFQDIVLKGGAFKDLFLSNVAFVNRDTARLYGLDPAAFGTTPTRTTLDATKRPGFLTRVGFLSTFSHFDATSPIQRGAFISGRVLGVPPGTPDPNVINMQPPPGNYTTNRQKIEALTGVSPCSTCHGPYINPPGFVMERYNAVGSWQDTDPLKGAIDSTANVRFSETLTKTVSTPLEMMTEIANLPESQRNYAEQWVAFASGRVPNTNDACTVNQLGGNLGRSGYLIVNLMADYTQADSFRLRTVGN